MHTQTAHAACCRLIPMLEGAALCGEARLALLLTRPILTSPKFVACYGENGILTDAGATLAIDRYACLRACLCAPPICKQLLDPSWVNGCWEHLALCLSSHEPLSMCPRSQYCHTTACATGLCSLFNCCLTFVVRCTGTFCSPNQPHHWPTHPCTLIQGLGSQRHC